MKLRNRPARSKAIFPVRSFLQLEQLESRESPTDIANVIGNAALAASFGGFPAEGTEPSLPFAVDDLSQASQTRVLSDLPILEPEPVKTES
ncbi:MAG: hypothetical protein HY040_21630, partial [Planctomycetes bacterium]|nr:hypothetical protein [Planctomycetota bacterium]